MFLASPDSISHKLLCKLPFFKKDVLPAPSKLQTCQVLFVNGCDIPTLQRYRVSHQREQLELWGVTTEEIHYLQVRPEDADRAEVFIVYRCPWTDIIEQFIYCAHQQNKKVYFDIDDLVVDTLYTNELPVVKAMSPQEKAIFDDGVIRNGKTLRLCDGAIVTTEKLQHELSKFTPQVYINRNVASRDMTRFSELARLETQASNSDKVMLGYFSGSMTHNADFREVLPAIAAVMEIRPQAHLKVVGELELPSELQPFSDRIHTSPYVPWQELPKLIATADINLAPLGNTVFNEAKSENKWIEASLVGVPTVASRVGAFARMIEPRKTGILCEKTTEWIEALLHLIDNTDARNQLGKQAHDYCLAHCVSERTGFQLSSLLLDRPQSIEALTPTDQESRNTWVRAYLSEREMNVSNVSFDFEPWNNAKLTQRIADAQQACQAGKKSLLLIYERECGDTATFRYFGYNVAQRLEQSNSWHGIYLFIDELAEASELVSSATVIALIRCRIRPELLELAEVAKQNKTSLAYVIDDNALGASTAQHIIQVMATNPNDEFERNFWKGATARFQLASQLADGFFAPVRYFAHLLEKSEKKPAFVIHSSLNDEQISIANFVAKGKSEANKAFFDIGYFSGTASHQNDFSLVHNAVVEFLSMHRAARLVLCGQLTLSDELYSLMLQGKVIVLPRVDYVTLQYLQAAVDVILAPLLENEFTNCKSALKVFEAGAVGTPACASPTSAYLEAIEEGSTGKICRNQDEWLTALETLYENRSTALAMGDSAREFALAHYYGDRILLEIEEACEALASLTPSAIPPAVKAALAHKHIEDWDNPFEVNPAFA